MERTWYNVIIVLNVLHLSILVCGETFSVKIGGEHVNVVDKNFLSFTVDPMHLFSSVDTFNNKECTCMASFLTPAYLRIAGPSTSHMTFENTTITIDNYQTKDESNKSFFKNLLRKKKRQVAQHIKISNRQWREFLQWAEKTGFNIVFALNNDEKTSSGMWDTSSAMTVLTLAEKENIKNIVWQLAYECNDKTIDEYLNDLETLRVLVETVQGKKSLGWRTAGSDVTKCLRDSSDFRDYVALAVDMTDVLLLNGNASSQELERMTTADRIKLLTLLHHSANPLWITEYPQWNTEFKRAVDWMTSLGYSARNGFSVHFRELMVEELYEPALSFYMALLFKNLVGERVLKTELESSGSMLFAHCASLRRQPVPKAVTLYAANVANEPARVSLRIGGGKGSELMQFILRQEENGDISVNDRIVSNEGGFRPVVKHVRPYKSLLIHLPAKSFGFWVLANTNVAACQEVDNNIFESQLNNTGDFEVEKGKVRRKRFTKKDSLDLHDVDVSHEIDNSIDTAALREMINNLNNELRDAQNFFNLNPVNRFKRQAPNENKASRKLRRQLFKPKKDFKRYDDFENKPILSLIGNLLQLTRKNITISPRKPLRLYKKLNGNKYHYDRLQNVEDINKNDKISRSKRSVSTEKYDERYKNRDFIKDNEIDTGNDKDKLWNVLNGIQNQLKKISVDISDNDLKPDDTRSKSSESEKFKVKTEISDDDATINISESPGHGVVKTTFDNLFSVLSEMNRNLNKFWTALSFLE